MAGRSVKTSGNAGWQVNIYKNGVIASQGLVRLRKADAEREWDEMVKWVGKDTSAQWEVRIEELIK